MHPRLAALQAKARGRAQRGYLSLHAWLESLAEIRAGDPAAEEFAAFGPGSRIAFPRLPFINTWAVSIGANTYIRSYFCVEAYPQEGEVNVRIGDGIQLGHGVRIVAFNGIELEDFVGLGHGCTIGDSVHDWKGVSVTEDKALWDTPPKRGRTLRIGRGAFLGNNCVVTGGITIGEWSIADHNTVINKDVPPRCIIGGYPARVLRRRRDDGNWETLEDPPLLADYKAEAA
jgi:acetyltransferase-like isoleucine patch superfamily enzyme